MRQGEPIGSPFLFAKRTHVIQISLFESPTAREQSHFLRKGIYQNDAVRDFIPLHELVQPIHATRRLRRIRKRTSSSTLDMNFPVFGVNEVIENAVFENGRTVGRRIYERRIE